MTYEDAIILAVKTHADQRRWDGSPYVLHPLRVAQRVAASHDTDELRIAAVLHDVIEDGDPRVVPEVAKFGPKVAEIVHLVTRTPPTTYSQFIQEIAESGNEIAIRVKLADLEDNLWDLPEEHSLRKRYEKAKAALTLALSRIYARERHQ